MDKKYIKVLRVVLTIVISFLVGYFINIKRYRLIDVPVAASFLDKRSIIKNKDIKTIKVPLKSINEDVILDPNVLIGKYIDNDYYVNEGSFFYFSFIDDQDNMNDIDYIDLDRNKTIYELFVKNVSVNAAHLDKNMYVDLYLTLDKPYVMSDLFISGAMVCGLYNNSYEELNEKSENKNNSLSIISLIVDKDMVSLLNKAVMLGEVNLIPCNSPYERKDCYINRKGDIINYLN